MSTPVARAHIAAQERLRNLVGHAVQNVWLGLPAYNDDNVDEWLTQVLPVVAAGQRQAVALTEAFLARSLGRQPLGINPDRLTGASVRAGADPAEVYRRPFVSTWSALQTGRTWEEATRVGLTRATSTAATDVQLSMRATLREVGEVDSQIVGYERVPDGGACTFCKLVAGQRYRTGDLMPIHAHCGCGVDVITGSRPPTFTGDTIIQGDQVSAAIRTHGELGPVLVNAAHHFTAQQDI